MLLKALDLLRFLGWQIIIFIYSLIDNLYKILKQLNAFDIIDNIASQTSFKNFHSYILIISLSLFGLSIIWTFVKKIIDSDEGPTISQIIKEIFKCGFLIILSTFLFSEVSNFSIKLTNFISNISPTNSSSFSNSMLEMFVDYSEEYNEINNKNDIKEIHNNIENGNFTKGQMYNEKYERKTHLLRASEQDYIYSINWILSILVGSFFLYSMFFSGINLARRQIEFCFLFLISPIVFAFSICNKNRRNAVFEQLTSLVLQGIAIMLIFNITIMVMNAVNNSSFFDISILNNITKCIIFLGCASFLLTGSTAVNRFIGSNVSANNGREQLMSLMSFGQTIGNIGNISTNAISGAGMITVGSAIKTTTEAIPNMEKIGKKISDFGDTINNFDNSYENTGLNKIGKNISNFGHSINDFSSKINSQNNNLKNVNQLGTELIDTGFNNIKKAINSFMPK